MCERYIYIEIHPLTAACRLSQTHMSVRILSEDELALREMGRQCGVPCASPMMNDDSLYCCFVCLFVFPTNSQKRPMSVKIVAAAK